MGNFYTFALLELFLHCYTLGKKTLCALSLDNFTQGKIFFTLALLVLLVTNIMPEFSVPFAGLLFFHISTYTSNLERCILCEILSRGKGHCCDGPCFSSAASCDIISELNCLNAMEYGRIYLSKPLFYRSHFQHKYRAK